MTSHSFRSLDKIRLAAAAGLCVLLSAPLAHAEIQNIKARVTVLSTSNTEVKASYANRILHIPLTRIRNLSEIKNGAKIPIILYPEDLGISTPPPPSQQKK